MSSTSFAFETCPAPKICDDLYINMENCNKDHKKCDPFLITFEKVLPKYDCRRNLLDKFTMSASTFCDSYENAVELISKLKSKKAKKIFGSDAFRATLDGALAEDYRAKSEKVGKQLKSK
jgi:hypothetical protein